MENVFHSSIIQKIPSVGKVFEWRVNKRPLYGDPIEWIVLVCIVIIAIGFLFWLNDYTAIEQTFTDWLKKPITEMHVSDIFFMGIVFAFIARGKR